MNVWYPNITKFVPQHLKTRTQQYNRNTTTITTRTSSFKTFSTMDMTSDTFPDPWTSFVTLHEREEWGQRDYILLWWFCHHRRGLPISNNHRRMLYPLKRSLYPVYINEQAVSPIHAYYARHIYISTIDPHSTSSTLRSICSIYSSPPHSISQAGS